MIHPFKKFWKWTPHGCNGCNVQAHTHTNVHNLKYCQHHKFLTGAVIWGCPDRGDRGSSWRGVGPLSVSLYCWGRAYEVILGVTILQNKHTKTKKKLVIVAAQTQNPIFTWCLTVFSFYYVLLYKDVYKRGLQSLRAMKYIYKELLVSEIKLSCYLHLIKYPNS